MKEKILPFLKDRKNKGLIIGLLALGLIALFLRLQAGADKPLAAEDPMSADTVIPHGFVLVPVEIQNIDSLSSLIGSFAIVDLFTTTQVQQKGGTRVGKRIRLIRAPLNPQTFAALIPENEAHELLQAQGPFTAVIQNPDNSNPAEIIKKKKTSASRIEYFKGAQK